MKKNQWFLSTLTLLGLLISTQSSADRIKLLETNEEGLQARVDLIQNAKSEILVEYYEVASDSLSLTGLSLLKNAADRGVKVKILIDGLHNSLKKEEMAAIMSKNIEIRQYNPFQVYDVPHMLYRNHDKLMNVDGNTNDAYMIIGGRNAAKNYFGKAIDLNFKDADALINGKSANESYKYFMTLWNSNPEVKKVNLKEYTQENLDKKCLDTQEESNCEDLRTGRILKLADAKKRITNYFDDFKAGNAWIREEPISEMLKDIEEVGDVNFVCNDPTLSMPDIDNKLSNQIMASLLNTTTKNLTIITPYLFPTEAELQTLETLAKRRIKIKIVTNSLQSTDVVIVHAALLTIKKRLADMGVELYLYKGPETLHAKGAIIDDKISLIGSFNFDKKSAEINREIGIRVGANGAFTTEFTKEFSAFINTQVIGNSFLAAKDGVEFSLVEFDSNVSKTKKKTFNFSKKFVGLFRNII